MAFTPQQRHFLETVCVYFHENGKWATYDEVEQALIKSGQEDLDVIEIGRELDAFLHDGLHAQLHEGDMGNPVYISLSALHTCQVECICPQLDGDFDVFMQLVHVCVEKYREAGRHAQVSYTDMSTLIEPGDVILRKVFLLAEIARVTSGSSYGDGAQGNGVTWVFGVDRSIRHYRNVATIDEFVAAREAMLEEDRRLHPVAYGADVDETLPNESEYRTLRPISLFPDDQFTVNGISCFVLMPFADEMRPVYDDAIMPAATQFGLICRRADEIFKPGGIMAQVWQYLMEARVVIADLTHMNPNVFYELGLAHSIGHDVIMLTQNTEFVPFDLRHMRCFVYNPSLSGLRLLEQQLLIVIREVLNEPAPSSR